MAAKKGMTDKELAALCRSEIDDSIAYERDDLLEKRRYAIEYYKGEMSDVPAQDGRSSVTTHDIADTIGWIMPQVMRSFTGSDIVAEYEPNGPEDEEAAKQATDYVNYKFIKDCEGYRTLYNGFHEGFLLGNGYLKHWWDTTPRYVTETYHGLDPDQFVAMTADPKVKILEHTEKPIENPEIGEIIFHDVKIRRTMDEGRIRVEALPHEEFLIERNAKSIEDANFVAHRYMATRSDLIAQGFDRKQVMSLGTDSELEGEETFLSRHDEHMSENGSDSFDRMMQEVEIFECYVKADVDGDDWAEWTKVIMAGSGSARSILDKEEWDCELPFTDFVPDPQPHTHIGRSIYDELVDLQKVKTVLMRSTLDNLYHTNEPMTEVVENALTDEGEEQLEAREFGGIVKVKSPGAINPLVVPFVANHSFQMLEYVDQMAERRTGAGIRTAGLDPDAMQNQTATAVQQQQSQQQGKIELYVRNLAENGVRRLFRCLLEIFVKNQPRQEVIRLRNEWVQMDPRQWSARMDATVTVGLGTGSKDRDLNMLNAVKMSQEQILMNMGPSNPLVSLDQYANTLTKLAETAGIKNPEMFFNRLSKEDVAAFQRQQSQQQQPDPKMIEAQAKIQIKQIETQANQQLQQQKAVFDARQREREAMFEARINEREAATKLQLQKEMQDAKIAFMEREGALKAQLREKEMMIEAQLTREANAMNAAVNASRPADTNINRPE
jgi:hypothetical protein